MATISRVHLDASLKVGDTLDLPDEAFRHVVQVLRARSGETLVLFNGRGGEYRATLTQINKRDAQVRVDACIDTGDARESALQLSLAQAVSKGDRMDYTLQKAVELGVSDIQPLITERTVVKLDAERWDKKLDHWRGVIISACEQSGRTRLPQLHSPLKLDDWLAAQRDSQQLRLTLAPTAERSLRAIAGTVQSACLLVGPEGGLSDAEIRRSVDCGFEAVRFGPRVLRTETAGVAALAAIQALWGDLG